MKKNIIILSLIFILPLVAYFMLSKDNQGSITVATTNRPQVIKFTSNMCGECKRVEPVVQKVMTKYQDTVQFVVIPVQVNNRYNREMISRYNVTLVPTIILLDKNQKTVKRIEGYIDEKTLDSYIGNICK
jgi:thioredoxin 1